jgi:RND superfamily putative drug exporter
VIPILAAVFVYAVADRILGMIGFAGVELAKQSLSIMMVLLYAVVIDYSLFIFSRFRE